MYPATTKERIIHFIRCLLASLWIFFPGLITIIASFFLFIKLSLGQDIVIQVSEFLGPRCWSLAAICFWAYVVWYSARIIGYQKKRPDDRIWSCFMRHFPRLMAYNAFVSIQSAILALPAIQQLLGIDAQGGLSTVEIVLFILFQNTIYLLIHLAAPATATKLRLKRSLLLAAIALNLLFWGYLFFRSQGTPQEHIPVYARYLTLYACILFLMQLLFTRAFIWREHFVRRQDDAAMTPKNQELNKAITNDDSGDINELPFFIWFNILASVGLGMYAVSIASIWFADCMGPLAVVLTAFGFLVGLAGLLSYASIRIRINLFFIWLIVLVVSGSLYDPYKVRLADKAAAFSYTQRPDIYTYLSKWVNNPVRKPLISAASPAHPFDVYLVLSDGGASRSGYWVASVLSAMEDCTGKDTARRFSTHLFCLSSASGGSVGNTAFYTLLHHGNKEYTPAVQRFLRTDFLSYLMARYLGPDIWGHYGLFGDRAAALEEVMEAAADHMYKDAYRQPFDQLIDTTGRLPVLFVNTTEVQHGMPSVISSVRLQDFSKRYDVLQIVDSSKACRNKNIRLSTAAILSSRFPYISPAGNLGGFYFVDGGYFDNSGAGVVHEMMIKLDAMMLTEKGPDTALFARLRFHLIHITNGSDSARPKGTINALANTLAAPMITVLATYGSQTDVNNDRLNQYFRSRDSLKYIVEKEINLYRPKETEEYPMNWVISDYNLRRMNDRLREVMDTFKTARRYGLEKTDAFNIYDIDNRKKTVR